MTYYPVFIPTLNRYDRFKDCIESLRQCTYADKTELVVGLDYPPADRYRDGYEKIKAFLPTIKGFTKVTIFERDHNFGAMENWYALADYCLKHYDAFIATEDDNVFSPCFLDYMNQALNRFRNDKRIVSVGGYSHPTSLGTCTNSAYLSYTHSAWGEGFWRDKYRQVKRTIEDDSFFLHMVRTQELSMRIANIYPRGYWSLLDILKSGNRDCWDDLKWSLYNITTGHFQLQPAVSLVRNMGCDGSGLHCDVDKTFSQQTISPDTTFDMTDNPSIQRIDIEGRGPRWQDMPADPIEWSDAMEALYRRARRVRLKYTRPWWWLFRLLGHSRSGYGLIYKLCIKIGLLHSTDLTKKLH
jgi:glycosyltransferase involved in cell wall biosynthesis